MSTYRFAAVEFDARVEVEVNHQTMASTSASPYAIVDIAPCPSSTQRRCNQRGLDAHQDPLARRPTSRSAMGQRRRLRTATYGHVTSTTAVKNKAHVNDHRSLRQEVGPPVDAHLDGRARHMCSVAQCLTAAFRCTFSRRPLLRALAAGARVPWHRTLRDLTLDSAGVKRRAPVVRRVRWAAPALHRIGPLRCAAPRARSGILPERASLMDRVARSPRAFSWISSAGRIRDISRRAVHFLATFSALSFSIGARNFRLP